MDRTSAWTLFCSVFIAFSVILYYIITSNYYFSLFILPNYFPYDTKRILELVVLVISQLLMILSPQIRQTATQLFFSLPSWARVSCFTILVLGIISSLIAPLPKIALMEVATFTCLFFFAFLIASLRVIWQEQFDTWLINLLLCSIAAYLIYFFVTYINSMFYHLPLNNMPGYLNIRVFAHYLVWTLPLVCAPILQKRKFTWLCIIAVLWWSMLWVENSKGLLIAYGLAIGITGLLFGKNSFKSIMMCVYLAVFSFIIYALFFYLPQYFFHGAIHFTPMHASTNIRWSLWKLSWHYIKSNPWLGLGPMHFAYYINPWCAGPSNEYLSIATQWGMPTFLLCMSILGYALKKWASFVRFSKSNSHILYLLTISFLASLFYMSVDDLFTTATGQILMALIIGWLIGIYFSRLTCRPVKSPQHVWYMVTILATSFIIFIVPPQLSLLTQQEVQWHFKNPTQEFFPAYWLQGWIIKK